MKLNGWQRIGIALSILWAVVAGIHTRNDDVDRAENFVKFAYKVCSDGKMVAHDTDLSSCEKEKAVQRETWMKDSDKNVAFAALAPIPFGWIAKSSLSMHGGYRSRDFDQPCRGTRCPGSGRRIYDILWAVSRGGPVVCRNDRHEPLR